MKIFTILFISTILLSSCTSNNKPNIESPKTEINTVDIGNKTITTITGSSVQPIR